jgi:hypothetical protein
MSGRTVGGVVLLQSSIFTKQAMILAVSDVAATVPRALVPSGIHFVASPDLIEKNHTSPPDL